MKHNFLFFRAEQNCKGFFPLLLILFPQTNFTYPDAVSVPPVPVGTSTALGSIPAFRL